jgi:lysine-N-methylase
MLKSARVIQPRYFNHFECIGSDCEDTCCDGWGITIDQATFQKYRDYRDERSQAPLSDLVTINPAATSDRDYAKINLAGTRCPSLSNGLCSIQEKLGEDYLSQACATFPRVLNMVDGVLQRSLHLSCPEAARLVLLNPDSMVLEEQEYEPDVGRPGSSSLLDADRRLYLTRERAIALLRNRRLPLSERLVALGGIVGDFEANDQKFVDNITLQLETTLEMIVSRITAEFTARRFLDCYGECMQGLQWTADSTMQEIGVRYTEAYSRYYAPFFTQHGYILENYLLNAVFRTLFPFGRKQSDLNMCLDYGKESARESYLLMVADYAVIKTVLTGMAGFHREAFNVSHVVQAIQSFTKAFQHSSSYPKAVLRILEEKGMDNLAGVAVLAMPA